MARRVTTKKVKKEWFPILAPKPVFGQVELGETPATDITKCLNRTVELPLEFIFEKPPTREQFWVKFRIVEVDPNLKVCYTDVQEVFLARRYLLSLAQPGTKKVEHVFDETTKDGRKVRVKLVIITAGKAHRSQKTAIRKKAEEFLREFIKNNDLYTLIEKTIKRELQPKIAEICRKIYPIRYAEIRKIEVRDILQRVKTPQIASSATSR